MSSLLRVGVCSHCNRTLGIRPGAGLCDACYTYRRRHGTLDGYRPKAHTVVRDYLGERSMASVGFLVADLGYAANPESLARLLYREAGLVAQYAKQVSHE